MASWVGIALALRAPAEDALHSRLSTYLHPLAGRILAWHALSALTTVRPAPARALLVGPDGFDRVVLRDLPVEPVASGGGPWWDAVEPLIPEGVERLLIVDAAAAALHGSLGELRQGPVGRVLVGGGGEPLAVWVEMGMVVDRLRGGEVGGQGGGQVSGQVGDRSLESLAAGLEPMPAIAGEGVLVRDRASLARAGVAIRDRLVANLLEDGVTFLLPETVLVDLDVRIGSDTIIYPGVSLEGQTTIGTETVIGPGCRIIDSWIGSGVELKGWNYIAGANVRNRAVLEPYVRRGFD